MSSLFFGRQIALEILKSDLKVGKLFLVEGCDPEFKEGVLRLAKEKGVLVQNVAGRYLDQRIRGNHQGVAVEAEPIRPLEFKTYLTSLSPSFKGYLCLCDGIEDPQNLGAIIRSAVCFDCSGIVLPTRRSAPLTEAVMRASSGALVCCPIAQIANLGVAIERLKEKGFYILGAVPNAKTDLHEVELQFPLALVLGSEHEGIRPVLSRSCDQLVTIGQSSRFNSLNVSAAAAIFFREFYRTVKGV